MKYFAFGMKKLRVTQSYNGTVSHKPHWYKSKNYCDYPIDIAGSDGGQDIYYATVDMKVTAIRGIGSSYTNTIWLESLENCITPLGNNIRPFIGLTHWNDNDEFVRCHYVGEIIKAGTPICREGTDGASANHLHMICGDANRGTGDNLIKNSNGKWVSNGYCYRPEQIMFINKAFTEVLDSSDIKFSYIDIVAKKGESSEIIEKIDKFLSDKVKGNYFGDFTETLLSLYKKKKGIKNTDGSFIDSETLEVLNKDGLEL